MTAPIDFRFIQGVSERADSKVQVAPFLLRAENLRVKPGHKGLLSKRRGTVALDTSTVDSGWPTPRGPVRMFSHNNQLMVADESALWTHSTSDDQLEPVDLLPTTTVTDRLGLGHYTSKNVIACGCARITAFTVWAWIATDGTDYVLHVSARDNATGAGTAGTVARTSTDAVLSALKVVPINDTKISVFFGDDTNDLLYIDITSAVDGPWAANQGTVLINGGVDPTDPQWFDVMQHGTGYVVAAFNGTTITLTRYNASHASQATTTVSFTGASPRVALATDMVGGNGATMALIVCSTTNYLIDWRNDALSSQGTDTSSYAADGNWDNNGVNMLAACSACISGTAWSEDGVFLVIEGTTTAGDNFMRPYGGPLATGVTPNDTQQPNQFIASKPWFHDGDIFWLAEYYTEQANSHYAVVRSDPGLGTGIGVSSPYPETRVLQGQAPGEVGAFDDRASSVGLDTSGIGTKASVPLPLLIRYSDPSAVADPTGIADTDEENRGAEGNQTIRIVGVDGYVFAQKQRDRFLTTRLGPYTALGGGTVMLFDGKRLSEMGFYGYPDVADADLSSASTGGNLSDGTYTFGLLWEWQDNLGNVHQSAPKIVSITLSGGTDTQKITIPSVLALTSTMKPFRLTGDDDKPIALAIYMSEVDGDLLHRLEGSGVTAFPTLSHDQTLVANQATAAYEVTYDISAAGISLSSRELLYASSFGRSELPNMPPPPSRVITAHDGRLWGINDEDPTQVWYSKLAFPGTAPAWNFTLIVQFEEPVTAIASQDSNFVAFSETSIYTVVGRGYDNTGSATNYEAPQRLSGDRGCTNARSLVSTPKGIFFQSQRGIELLERGGSSPEYIGIDVEETLASYPTIVRAVHIERDSQIWFACVDTEVVGSSPNGRVLVYDYNHQIWAVYNYQGEPISDICVHNSAATLGIYNSATAMTVWQEDAGFDDGDGSFVSWVIETGDLRIGGHLSGLQSIWFGTLHGQAYGVETISVEETVNARGSYATATTYSVTTTETNFQRRYQTNTIRAGQHGFRISSAVYSGTVDSEGVALAGILLEGKPHPRAVRLPAAQEA